MSSDYVPPIDPAGRKASWPQTSLVPASKKLPKSVKRRPTKACAVCRARKVRCNVMHRYHITADDEVTCSNCAMDGIKCVISESKRRRNHQVAQPAADPAPAPERTIGHAQLQKNDILPFQNYITPQQFEVDSAFALLKSTSIDGDRTATQLLPLPIPPTQLPKRGLPRYLKPLPQRMTSTDIEYLFARGALSLPDIPVRNSLLQSYLEYVHPYMPLIDMHELMEIVEEDTGATGTISLLLFQAIMFAGTAFVDIEYLRCAGFSNRKVARKALFQKARVLYDFDCESDRVSLIQSLLLMTYCYETPDDLKDTWHWMGVAISLAQTIGLHRNLNSSDMGLQKKKLWKRIWWSCLMRDLLIALGMGRPTRVKDEDYDVPMLSEDDFGTDPLPDHISIISRECTLARDVKAQKELVQMCIAKAKLCLCISHVLRAQYSVLVPCQGMQGRDGSTSGVMLFPKKVDKSDEVQSCDLELSRWISELPPACLYSNELGVGNSAGPIFVHRALLNMVYFTTLSTLHRPQVLPSTTITKPDRNQELRDISWEKVRDASREITRISNDLCARNLESYLPTTGVTVLLPAIIVHLLDIKSCNDGARQVAVDGFRMCMHVLEKLGDNYASADLATQFLEAAIHKADIDVMTRNAKDRVRQNSLQAALNINNAKEATRWIPPLGNDHGIYHNLHRSNTMDIRIPISDQDDLHNKVLTRTAESENIGSHDTLPWTGLDFTVPLNSGHVDLNDFLTFTQGNEFWNFPLEKDAYSESGGFIGDINWAI